MLIALDFESDPIEPRPKFPPRPVGLAIASEEGHQVYYAWGHPMGNDTCIEDVCDIVKDLFNIEDHEYVFHNAPFDCSIIEEKLNIKVPWGRVHDTMLQAFLFDPYGELSLKPLAERYLGEPPTERDIVRDWLISRNVVTRVQKDWGAHIGKAPPAIVGPYAIGDCTRTLKLYRFFQEKLIEREMQ